MILALIVRMKNSKKKKYEKKQELNIICSLLLAGGMCACTATPKQTEEINGANVWTQSEMQRFPEPLDDRKAKKPRLGRIRTDWW